MPPDAPERPGSDRPPPATTERWVLDHRGTHVRLDQARADIRRSLGDCDDEMLAANAAGRVHPEQVRAARAHRRTRRRIVHFFMAVLSFLVVVTACAVGFGGPDPGPALRWGLIGVAGFTALGFLIGSGIGRSVRVVEATGQVTGRGENPDRLRPQLAGAPIPVDPRWIGKRIRAYVVPSGLVDPLYLSGDLEQPVTTVPGPEVVPARPAGPALASPAAAPVAGGPAIAARGETIVLDRQAGSGPAAIAEIRRLVDDLGPPAALDALGLEGALREQAVVLSRRADGEPLAVSVLVDGDLGGLPAAVEVAIYRIVTEALTNVVRHSTASTATVSLTVAASGSGSWVTVVVGDDGVNVAAGWTPGVGLSSIRERTAELGGVCELRHDRAGGRVSVTLPLTVSRPEPDQPTSDLSHLSPEPVEGRAEPVPSRPEPVEGHFS